MSVLSGSGFGTASDEVDDLDRVSFADTGCLVRNTLDHDEVLLDRDEAGIDVEVSE